MISHNLPGYELHSTDSQLKDEQAKKIYSLETSSLFIFSVNDQGIIHFLDGKDLKKYGIVTDFFIGRNINDIDANENKYLSMVKDALNSGEQSTITELENKYYEIYYSYLTELKTHTIGVVKDVTDEIQLKEEVMVKDKYFAQLFENSPDGIVIVDKVGRIMNFNKSFEKLFGFKLEETKNSIITDLIIPERFLDETRNNLNKAINGEVIKLESLRKRKDGKEIQVSILFYPILIEKTQKGAYGIYSDISKRKENEDNLRSSLLEKEILLREVHHRVKNNLQIISSLLSFQSRFIKDEEALKLFKESQNRVKSIGLIHEKLYQTKDISRLDFSNYIKSLIGHLFLAFGVRKDKITFKIFADNIFLSVDNAIPCGLIINELVTNSLKYAFPDNRKGEIVIGLSYRANQYVLTVKDNGIGIPESIDINKTDTLGLQLVKTLTDQLDAEITVERNAGTSFKISFTNLNYKKRI